MLDRGCAEDAGADFVHSHRRPGRGRPAAGRPADGAAGAGAAGRRLLIDDVAVPRSRIAALPRRLRRDRRAAGGRHRRGRACRRRQHAPDRSCFDGDDADQRDRADAAFGEILELGLALGGTITGEHGVGNIKVDWLEREIGPVALDVHRAIKDALDPQGLLNPGKVFRRAARATSRRSPPVGWLSCPEAPRDDTLGAVSTDRLVVIGGDAAGVSAAAQARRLRERLRPRDRRPRAGAGRVLLRLRHPVLDRRRWSATATADRPHARAVPAAGHRRAHRHRAESASTSTAGEVRGATGRGERDSATTTSSSPPAAGRCARRCPASTPTACTACTGSTTAPPSAPRSRRGAKRAVVLGGGYIGLEMAEVLQARGLHVTVVDSPTRSPMAQLDPDMGELVCDAMCDDGHRRCAPTSRCRESRPTPTARSAACVTDQRASYEADLVVLGLGVRPERGARPRGRPPAGHHRRDRRRQPHAQPVDPGSGRPATASRPGTGSPGERGRTWRWAPTPTSRAGSPASTSAAATRPSPASSAPPSPRSCDLEVARTGLTTPRPRRRLRLRHRLVDSTTKAGYFPGAAPITVKLIAERRSGRLLGAQIVGRAAAAKRIDALAIASGTR